MGKTLAQGLLLCEFECIIEIEVFRKKAEKENEASERKKTTSKQKIAEKNFLY